MKKLLLTIWQLPQLLLASGIRLYTMTQQGQDYKDAKIFLWNQRGSMTLGNNIFLSTKHFYNDYIRQHEYGHTIQSKYLGPLYLLIIGLPSICWAGLRRMIPSLRKKNYYSFYTEHWANKLVGLE